nr:hypothetical protein [Clostridia bacterium]
MYELFASIYCDLCDLTKDLRRDQALDIQGCSAVEKYKTDDKDSAVRRFQASNSYISFCERFLGHQIFIYVFNKDNTVFRVDQKQEED